MPLRRLHLAGMVFVLVVVLPLRALLLGALLLMLVALRGGLLGGPLSLSHTPLQVRRSSPAQVS